MSKNPLIIKLPKPHRAQQQMLDESARFIVGVCGRRFGKTSFIPTKRLKMMLAGQPGAYFAPNYKMLQEYYRQTKAILNPIISHVSKQEHRFEFITGGSYTMWSLDNPDSARGQKYAFADVDEAAMIRELEEAWNAVIRPTLTDYEGSAGFWSTPKGLNYFHTLFARGDDAEFTDWKSFQFPTASNPFINPNEIEQARKELPSEVFRQEYLAEFIQGEGAVFRNIAPNLSKDQHIPDDHRDHTKVLGGDWGQVADFTALSVVCETCKKEVELLRFNQIDWEFQREKALNLMDKWNVTFAFFEENSIGSPNLEALREKTRRDINGFMTTAQSKPPLIRSLALCFEQEEITWLDIPVATRELEAYEATRNEMTNRISYQAAPGFHDDSVIARALARHALEERKNHQWSIHRRNTR